MRKLIYILSALCFLLAGCDRKYDSPLDDGRVNSGKDDPKPKYYLNQYDPISDQGQYWHPDMMKKMPTMHYELYATSLGNRNETDIPGGDINAGSGFGLQYHLLCQSLNGINDIAVSNGSVYCGMWMDAANTVTAYKDARRYLGMAGPSFIVWAGNMLTNPGFLPLDGGVMDALGRNYVLTDVRNNPESSNVAIVAAHVHKAIIVDDRDKAFFDTNGFQMVYDARTKTTADSWREFKDKCNNRALAVIPAQTGELADFAIANGLFVINLNKQYGTSSKGQNTELFKEVLAWLQPNSPVYGWEPGVGEDEFVNLVSKSGNMMVAIHEFNLPYFSYNYKERQQPLLAHVVNPQDIDFEKDKKFVSFYLSDGPHAGWMMNGFVENYYNDPNVDKVKMSFGVTASNISMIDPLSFERIINQQSKKSTLMESFGGGYYYSDDFGTTANRKELLEGLAKKVADHMRQHRIKVLEQIAHDPKSAASMEAYQAFVDANDQLEGIIAIQYAPSYAEAGGEILWVTNKEGYKIPIITVCYSIWNMGAQNRQRDGTPTFVANRLNQSDSKFSSVIIHAWSDFTDTGQSTDEIAENAAGGGIRGAAAAEMCVRRLSEDYQVVNLQELIWRVRMHYEPEQTNKYLSEYY
ncbi:hypothetical protein D0T84_10140 [Dysgonomonas sp. 521]|uniref:GxGYxYP domain-containing protein n=1 Tax=Dysgonomonas sp. 521 TaxID=2302932 RepID=UPI0013CF98C5|nr:GxGYxYP domain-containing protein [Dysgonomonas sp. 521]NDV95278.1 hypothetical protein [Dysgonomonas sp. 521]